jgi:hypothetical protein
MKVLTNNIKKIMNKEQEYMSGYIDKIIIYKFW